MAMAEIDMHVLAEREINETKLEVSKKKESFEIFNLRLRTETKISSLFSGRCGYPQRSNTYFPRNNRIAET